MPTLAVITKLEDKRIMKYSQHPKRWHPYYRMITYKCPNFLAFLERVAEMSGQGVARCVWLRVCIEIRSELRENSIETYELLQSMPEDPVIPPLTHQGKPVLHYLEVLDEILRVF
jgi:hypothetical protein